jgi:hypothetical protein
MEISFSQTLNIKLKPLHLLRTIFCMNSLFLQLRELHVGNICHTVNETDLLETDILIFDWFYNIWNHKQPLFQFLDRSGKQITIFKSWNICFSEELLPTNHPWSIIRCFVSQGLPALEIFVHPANVRCRIVAFTFNHAALMAIREWFKFCHLHNIILISLHTYPHKIFNKYV